MVAAKTQYWSTVSFRRNFHSSSIPRTSTLSFLPVCSFIHVSFFWFFEGHRAAARSTMRQLPALPVRLVRRGPSATAKMVRYRSLRIRQSPESVRSDRIPPEERSDSAQMRFFLPLHRGLAPPSRLEN